MDGERIQLRLSGLDPADNLELQKLLSESAKGAVAMTVERSGAPDQRHGEPLTLALLFEIARNAAPAVLGVVSLWLEWRRKQSEAKHAKPVTLVLTLPSGEQVRGVMDPQEEASSGATAELLVKVAEKVASAAGAK